jgi:hypothetical protein
MSHCIQYISITNSELGSNSKNVRCWQKETAVTRQRLGKHVPQPRIRNCWTIARQRGVFPFEKVILKIAQRKVEERGMLNATQFVFQARHSTTLQYMSLTDHVTLKFSNIMSTAAVLLHIKRDFDTTWPPPWSSGQSSWLQILRSRVRFPALPDFLRSSGSGTGSTKPREDNWGATWMKK